MRSGALMPFFGAVETCRQIPLYRAISAVRLLTAAPTIARFWSAVRGCTGLAV
jgi:hypothetical protein